MTPPVAVARLADTPPQSLAWHDLRRAGIGSSDAAAIAGVDPFRSPFAVWAEKTADHWPSSDNAALTWGTRLESAVAEHFAEAHPEFLVLSPVAMFAHPEREWMRASPDRMLAELHANEVSGVLEIKTSRMDHAWEDGPPDYVVVQVQHQLAVMDLDWAYIAVLLHGRDYREYFVQRDPELIGYLYQIEERFWQRVQDGTPPPVDGSDATTNALRALYVPDIDVECVLPDAARGLLLAVRTAKETTKNAESEQTRLENQVKLLLGSATVGTLDGKTVVTWKPGKRRNLDVKAFREAHPALAAEFTTEVDTRTLTILKEPK